MNLMELWVKIGVEDKATSAIEGITEKVGNGLKKAAEVGAAAVAAVGAGVVAISKEAIDQYADYEQLVGGVDTLFKNSSGKLQKYADNAYKTAGVSANKYMEVATSFAASLLQSLDGDTEAAVEKTNMAIEDMSDNANKMGSSIESIQNAYQGFAKQNYTMLDNLKLGYGGTAQEMYRLMETAASLNEEFAATAEFELNNKGQLIADFDEIVDAIHIVQTEMGITGTTAEEAGATISGSTASMKAAWENLLRGIADENADLEVMFDNLVTSIVGDGTESNKGVLGNLLPRIEQVFKGIGTVADVARPYIEEGAVKVLDYFGVKMADGEQINASLFEGANGIVSGLATLITETDALERLTASATGLLTKLSEGLANNESLAIIGEGAGTIITNIGLALAESAPNIIGSSAKILGELIDGFFTEENVKAFSDGAVSIINTLSAELKEHKEDIKAGANALADALASILKNFDWGAVGKSIGSAVAQGVGSALESTLTAVGSVIGAAGSGALIDLMESLGMDIPQGLIDTYNEQSDWIENSPGLQFLEGIGEGLGLIESDEEKNRETIEFSNFLKKLTNTPESSFQKTASSFDSSWTTSKNQTTADLDAYMASIGGETGIINGRDYDNLKKGEQDININIDGETVATVTYDRYKNILMQKGG